MLCSRLRCIENRPEEKRERALIEGETLPAIERVSGSELRKDGVKGTHCMKR